MIVINIDKVLKEIEARKIHKPTIRIILPGVIEEAEKAIDAKVDESLEIAAVSQDKSKSLKEGLIWDMDNQERDLRIERAIQSNKYLPMIADGESQGELANHYKLIESISSEMRDVYDRREFVRQNGTLPEQGSAQASIDNGNILALREQKRSLINRRSKARKKIELGKAKNSPNLVAWELTLDKMDIEFKVVCDRINELRHE